MDQETKSTLILVFGILGNIVSVGVYLAPVPTFHQIIKRKSTEGFQSLPYVVALFSALLWFYYALFAKDAILLITINSFGCIVEFIYIALYTAYAVKNARDSTAKLFVSLNLGLFSLIALLTHILVKDDDHRVKVLGFICAAISVSVFAAPLGIVFRVCRTKSVEYMPFTLSLLLTLSAITWFCYGLLKEDLYVACPNILGFIFGVLQMVLYAIYRNAEKDTSNKEKLPEQIISVAALSTSEVHPVDALSNDDENDAGLDGARTEDRE